MCFLILVTRASQPTLSYKHGKDKFNLGCMKRKQRTHMLMLAMIYSTFPVPALLNSAAISFCKASFCN